LFRFSTKILYAFLISLMHATCPAHLVHSHLYIYIGHIWPSLCWGWVALAEIKRDDGTTSRLKSCVVWTPARAGMSIAGMRATLTDTISYECRSIQISLPHPTKNNITINLA
jgi:hypothetical protein